MRYSFLIAIHLVSWISSSALRAQEWRLYSAADAVKDFKAYRGQLWITAGSGLTRLDMATFETTTWNTANSDLSDYFSNKIAIDSSGRVWLGTYGPLSSTIIRFDGQAFETYDQINGQDVNNLLDMEVTPDGSMWLMASSIRNTLYRYNQSQFDAIPLPGPSYTYQRGSRTNICAGTNNHIWAILQDRDTETNYAGEYNGSAWILHDLSPYGVSPKPDDAWALDPAGHVYLLALGRETPALMQFDGQSWNALYVPLEAIDARYVDEPLTIDQEGQIHILLNSNALLSYDGAAWHTRSLSDSGFEAGHPQKLYLDAGSRWWVIQDQSTAFFPVSKLFLRDTAQTQPIDLSNSGLPTNEVYTVFADELDNMWMQSTMGLLKYNGQTWTSISYPETLDLLGPIGSDRAGGLWLETFHDYLGYFDGLTASAIPVTTPAGTPIDWIDDSAVDVNGRLLAAAYPSPIMVYDHGEISWLPQIINQVDPGFSYPVYPNSLAFGPDGTLYALSTELYRLEANSTWTQYPLWDDFAYASELKVAPDSVVWVADVVPGGLSYYYIFHLFDGTSWSMFDVPTLPRSMPVWDSHGYPWFETQDGLCQYANDTWTCYNRSNSPIVTDRIIDFTIDAQNNIWIVLSNGGLLLFNPGEIVNVDGKELPTAGGHVYRDINRNGMYDESDMPLAFQRELMLPDSVIAFSRLDGQYRINARNGAHDVVWIPRANWHIDNTPASYAITVADQSVSNLDFALAPDQEVVDLNLFLSEGLPRCNTVSRYTISMNNWGTLPEDVLVTFILDPSVTPVNINPQPDLVSGDTLSWYFSRFMPFDVTMVRLDLLMPGVEQELIAFRGYIDLIVNKAHERVDSIMVTQEIRCSFDPNDKIARSARAAGDVHVYPGDPIDYTIRFQNTGNDTAFQIVIRDTLDAHLDPGTLEILGASHPFEAYLKPDRTLEFRFPAILLPDSTTNELESHGFVSYRISAGAGLAAPAIIYNTAHIYFDFNGSIQTNTTVSELVDFGTGTHDQHVFSALLKAYPNPASHELWIEAIAPDRVPVSYGLTGMGGEPLLSGILEPGARRLLSIASLPAGVYVLHATSGQDKGAVLIVKGE